MLYDRIKKENLMYKLSKKRILSIILAIALIAPYFSAFNSYAADNGSVGNVNFKINNTTIISDPNNVTGEQIVYSISYGINGTGNVNDPKLVFTLDDDLEFIDIEPDAYLGPEADINGQTISLDFKNNSFSGSLSGSLSLKVRFKKGVTVEGTEGDILVAFQDGSSEICSKQAETAIAHVLDPQEASVKKTLKGPSQPALDEFVNFKIEVTTPPENGGLNLKNTVISDKIEHAEDIYITDNFDYDTSGQSISLPNENFVTNPPADRILYMIDGDDKYLLVEWDENELQVSGTPYVYDVGYKYKSGNLAIGGTRTNTASIDGVFYDNTPFTDSESETITFSGPYQPGNGDLRFSKNNRPNAFDPDEYSHGQVAKWYLNNIENAGNTPITNLVVTDTFPFDSNDQNKEFVRFEGLTLGRFSHSIPVRISIQKKGENDFTLWKENINTPIVGENSDYLSYQDENGSQGISHLKIEFLGNIPVGFKQIEPVEIRARVLDEPTDSTRNTAYISFDFTDENGVQSRNTQNSADIKITGAKPFYKIEKYFTNGSGPFHVDEDIFYEIKVTNSELATGNITAVDILDVVDDSAFNNYDYIDLQLNGATGAIAEGGLINNGEENDYHKYSFTGEVEPGESFILKFKMRVKGTTVRYGYKDGPAFLMLPSNPDNDNWVTSMTINDDSATNYDENAATTNYLESMIKIYNAYTGSLLAQKMSEITNNPDTYDTSDKDTTEGSTIKYKLKVANDAGNGPMQHVVLVEKMPKAGVDGSTLSPYLIGESLASENGIDPAGGGVEGTLKIYYTTDENPNLDRLNNPVQNAGPNAPTGWSEDLPSDVSKVTYIMYDFDGYKFETGDYAGVLFQVAVPHSATAGDVINNSYLYNAAYPVQDESGLTDLWLPFGTNKSTVVKHNVVDAPSAVLGDRVWFDKDKNGLQDNGETGINGVKVEVYDYGTNGNTTPTAPIFNTLTGENSAGENGYFLVPNLTTGHQYDIVYKVPTGEDDEFDYPNLKPTLQNVGGDESKDSDFAVDTTLLYQEAGYVVYSYSKANGNNYLAFNGANRNTDFGLYKVASIAIKVVEDVTHNGIDDSDTPIQNLTVTIKNTADPNAVETPLTYDAASGKYKTPTEGIDPGLYEVKIKDVDGNYVYSESTSVTYDQDADPENYTRSSNLQVNSSDTISETIAFKKAKIDFTIFEDMDYSGDNNGGSEQGLEIGGVKIHLIKDGVDTPYDLNANGNNSITGLDGGTYTIKLEVPADSDYNPTIGNNDWKKEIDPGTDKVYYVYTPDGNSNISIGAGSDNDISGGFYRPPSVEAFVWEDLNGNGLQELAELDGVQGVSVKLINADTSAEVASGTTGADGLVKFEDLIPGNYKLQVTKPDEFNKFTVNRTEAASAAINSDIVNINDNPGETATFTLVSGQDLTDKDAGLYKTISIGGSLFIEQDGEPNGNQDGLDKANDQPVTLKLYRKKDNAAGDEFNLTNYELIDTTVSSTSSYNFPNADLRPGSYVIEADLPDGYVISPDGDNEFEKSGSDVISTFDIDSQVSVTKDLGMYRGGKISGNVYEDLNGDGNPDGNEGNLGEVTVQLLIEDPDNPGTWTVYKEVVSTDGNFNFDNLPSGNYKIATVKDGFVNSYDDSTEYDLTTPGVETEVELGMYKKIEISGNVFLDENRDGINFAENPFSDITLELKSNGAVVQTVNVNADGTYAFTPVNPGEYEVKVVIAPENDFYNISPMDQGNDDNLDSDIDPATFASPKFTLTSGGEKDIDIGIYKFLKISGTVKDSSSSDPITGATLHLLDKDGNPVLDENGDPIIYTTGADGTYEFTELYPGEYQIRVESYYDNNGTQTNYPDIVKDIFGVAGGYIIQDFTPSKYIVTFTADPYVILGNGETKSTLTLTIQNEDGSPVANQNVSFDTRFDPAGDLIATQKQGTFDNNTAQINLTTNANGQAITDLTSADLEGYLETQAVKVKATATISETGETLEDSIVMIFEPASIQGIVQTGDNKIIPNSVISISQVIDVSLDADDPRLIDKNGYKLSRINDNQLLFEHTERTNENGEYKIFVPFSNQTYTVNITIPGEYNSTGQEITFEHNTEVGDFSGATPTITDANKTIVGSLTFNGDNGIEAVNGDTADKITVEYTNTNGDKLGFKVNDEGVLVAEVGNDALEQGTYTRDIYYTFGNGQRIRVASQTIEVEEDGVLMIENILIDPYGDITDYDTGAPVPGAEVTLYYATGLNAGQVVDLPPSDLALSENDNPQNANQAGNYAWMVFPNEEYYIIATKPGYKTYDSRVDGGYKDGSSSLTTGNIVVGTDIVRWDFKMKKIQPITPPVVNTGEVKQEISTDKNKAFVNDEIKVMVDYLNDGDKTIKTGWVKVKIPEGVKVVDPKEGIILGDSIYFEISDVKPNDRGQVDFVIAAEEADENGTLYKFESVIMGKNKIHEISKYSHTFVKIYPLDVELVFPSYIYGRPDGGFHPEDNVTRAEIAAILVRNTYTEPDMSKAKKFVDVPESEWFYDEVTKASAYGYFSGGTDGRFRPDDYITREELAKVVANYFGISNETESQITEPFSDIAGSFAEGEINIIARYGMINGYPDGTYRPKNFMIRTDTVALFNRLLYRYPTPDVNDSFYDITKSHWAYGDVESSFRGFKAKKSEGVLTLTANEKVNKYFEMWKERNNKE